MKETVKDLSPRYYIAEAACWLLGGILLVSHFFGIAPGQPLPFLNVTPANGQYYVRIVGALLIAAVLYLFVEWSQSSRSARDTSGRFIRLLVTIFWTVGALWLSYPVLSYNTRFAGISPAWYLGFAAIGFLLGGFLAILAFSGLMIRSPEEVKRLRLPRIPVATRAQFVIWPPVVALLLIAYFVLLRFSPSQIRGLAALLVIVPLVLMILGEFSSLCLARDEKGERISYAHNVARLKEIHNSHDYHYLLIDQEDRFVKEIDLDPSISPRQFQDVMQSYFSQPVEGDSIHFHVQQKEETQIRIYSKDGNSENPDPKNCGVQLTKRGNKKFLRVAVIPDDPILDTQEMEIPVAYIESYAEEYLSTHTEKDDLTFRKIFSHAINQSAIRVMMDEVGPLLFKVTMAGQIEAVRELIQQKDVNINERCEFGWTPLLAASAQGYPEIARLLLEAGANPDIGNVHGNTPLIYGALYGNTDVCSVLLEYQAALDIQDVFGKTALIVATREGNYSVVDMLIKAGADTTLKTRHGMTALDFAYSCKHGKIAKILRQANKQVHST